MKKYILSAIVCFNLLHTSIYAQQSYGAGTTNSTVNRNVLDASKLTEKEISMEVDAGKSIIFLDNTSRNIEIKTWNQAKVKITSKVFFDGKSALTDEQWLNRLNLFVKQSAGQVQITSRSINSSGVTYSSGSFAFSSSGNTTSNLAVFDGEGNNIGTVQNTKRTVTVFIPEGNKLEIDNSYGNIQLTGNIQNVTLKSNNGSFEAGDISRLVIRSKYTPVLLGNVKDAEIEMTNARLKAGNIDRLDIDSKYTTVEIAAVTDAMLRSSNDEYEIEEAGDIKGRKTYGNLRISSLKTAIDIEGANADIKIRSISPAVETININNKYADVRLPVNGIKNYEVKFNGRYNTVYAPFEKKPMIDTATNTNENNGVAVSSSPARSASRTYGDNRTFTLYGSTNEPRGFTAEAGDIKGKHTKFLINCTSCTVDFK